jgi:hypothetical protein
MAASVLHIRAGRFFIVPSPPYFSTLPPHARHFHAQRITTSRSHKSNTPSVGSSSVGEEVCEEEDETHNEAEAGLRALVCFVEALEEL